MPVTWTITRRDLRSFTATGGSVAFSVSVGARGAKGDDGADGQNGPNSIDDNTDLGTLTNAVADALSLLASNAAGTKARRVALAAIHRAILAAADAAGVRSAIGTDAAGDTRPPAAHTHPLSALTQSGATSGQVPAWSGSAWVATTVTSGGAWGSITGTLSSQTDLQNALNAKANTASPTITTPTISGTLTANGTVAVASGLVELTSTVNPWPIPSTQHGLRRFGGSVELWSNNSFVSYRSGACWLVGSGVTFGWSSASTSGQQFGPTTEDTTTHRAGPRVMGVSGATASDPGTLRSIPLTWTVTGTVNNAAPGVARRYRLSGSSTPIVTGISISQVDGQEFFVTNPNATAVQFNHQDAGSTAANRIICTGAANITLAQDEEAVVWYDATTSRFRMRKI